MEKRWNILSCPPEDVQFLQQQLHIHPLLCKILVQRGITNFAQAKSFFRPQLSDLHHPFLMKDMDKAAERIITAIEQKESILIFGDYDVDGTTAVASFYQFLSHLHPHVYYYIPHRYKEGYGLSKAGIDFAVEKNCSLLITLDCGIKSVELVEYAAQHGIDVIICDHHLPDEQIPHALAILNPKQTDCPYPYKELCGCGIGFKLMQALSIKLHLPQSSYLQFIDLVATATASDIVPMTGENRILCFYGLEKINTNPSMGLKALMHLANIKHKVHIHNLVFIVAPRINAAGRMNDAYDAIHLFIEKSYDKALLLAQKLNENNTLRKTADASITEEALALIKTNKQHALRKTTVVYQEHWHKGVIGIVASRLIENYYRPTVVLTKSGEVVSGSARSVPGFNLYEAIHACRMHLIGYGGHFAAAGLTLLPEQVPLFVDKFEEVVSAQITEQLLTPEIIIDAEVEFSCLSLPFFNIINQMEPFGPGNLRPVFLAKKITVTSSTLLKEQHIRFMATQNGISLPAIAFNMAHKETVLKSELIDIIFTLSVNEWNGQKLLQLKIIDFKPSCF